MTSPRKLLDPTPEQMRAALAEVLAEVGVGPDHGLGRWLGRVVGERQGVFVEDGDALRVIHAWWTDAIGRKHHHLQAGAGCPAADASTHPLEWIAQPLSCGWRERGGVRDFVVICRCGAVGAPRVLAWAGACCGPCADKGREGTPSRRPLIWPHLGWAGPWCRPLPGGRIVTMSKGAVRLWRSPDDDAPAWEADRAGAIFPVAENGRFLAAATAGGEVVVLSDTDGHPLARFKAGFRREGWRVHLAWCGPGRGRLLLTGWDGDGPAEILVADISPAGRLEKGPARLVTPRQLVSPPAVSPCGEFLAVTDPPHLEVYAVESGALAESLRVDRHPRATLPVFLPEGGVAAFLTGRKGQGLGMWPAGGQRRKRAGFFDWLVGPPVRHLACWADAERQAASALALTPDGGLVVVAGGSVSVWSATTLGFRGRFTVGGATQIDQIAFTADGRLLALTDKGLAVWPWRELMGSP